MMHFYLGTHQPAWLAQLRIPLFVSHRRLAPYKTLPLAKVMWALDSGGFSELSLYGGWRTTAAEYVAAVDRYDKQIGALDWAAPQDWMCEPWMLAKTGLTVAQHQQRTVDNFAELVQLWDEYQEANYLPYQQASCPFMPVLQGWTLDDYWRCVDLYAQAGIKLHEFNVVGLGSVCRRQATSEIDTIVRSLGCVLPLHGFGVKTSGLASYGQWLGSADSMAWSFGGRREPGCSDDHASEANCQRYALAWRDRVLEAEPGSEQLGLFRVAS